VGRGNGGSCIFSELVGAFRGEGEKGRPGTRKGEKGAALTR